MGTGCDQLVMRRNTAILAVPAGETNRREIPNGHPKGSAVDCGDLSPLFHAKLAELDFRGLVTFVQAGERLTHFGEGALLSKLRLGKAVTSHTQSMGFATPLAAGGPFSCALSSSTPLHR